MCIRAKKTRIQNYKAVTSVSQPAERIYINFWGPYHHGSINRNQYILIKTDDRMRYGWASTTKGRTFNELINDFDPWLK